MPELNADVSVSVAIDTAAMAWSASPSSGVWRKRLHLSGAEEAGYVTSVVRYDAHSKFAVHDHPGGEEILVLDGVFSDEHGDCPAGTYLLNPEGFRHAPGSVDGCLLFVKLRQYPGRDRAHITLQSRDLTWKETARSGVMLKPLYAQPGYADSTRIEAWTSERSEASHYPLGAELFVLEGEFEDDMGSHARGAWLRLPASSVHAPRVAARCEVYVKQGGLELLAAS